MANILERYFRPYYSSPRKRVLGEGHFIPDGEAPNFIGDVKPVKRPYEECLALAVAIYADIALRLPPGALRALGERLWRQAAMFRDCPNPATWAWVGGDVENRLDLLVYRVGEPELLENLQREPGLLIPLAYIRGLLANLKIERVERAEAVAHLEAAGFPPEQVEKSIRENLDLARGIVDEATGERKIVFI